MKNVVIYTRVSTEKQDYSRQIHDIEEYCKANNLNIVQEFSEKESGKMEDRPELLNMKDYIKLNNIQDVVISELSRLGRNDQTIIDIIEFKRNKVCIHSLKERMKTLNDDYEEIDDNMMFMNIIAHINKKELKTLNYRVKSGLGNAARNGVAMSGIQPFGFKKDGKKLVIDPEEAEVIKEIFTMYAAGVGSLKICNYLNAKGIKTRWNKLYNDKTLTCNKVKRDKEGNIIASKTIDVNASKVIWRSSSLMCLLKNPIYKGKRLYQGVELDIEAIIPEKLWNEVAEKRTQNKEHKKFDKIHPYLIDNDKIKCGVCGNYFGKVPRPKFQLYRCLSTRFTDTNCKSENGINVRKLEGAIYFILKNRFLTEFFNDKSEQSQVLKDIEIEKLNLKQLNKQLQAERDKMERVEDMYINADISKEKYKTRKEPIEREITILSNQIKQAEQSISKMENISKADQTLFDFNQDFASQHINKFLEEIKIYPANFQPIGEKKNIIDDRFLNETEELTEDEYINYQSVEYNFKNKQDVAIIFTLQAQRSKKLQIYCLTRRSDCLLKASVIKDIKDYVFEDFDLIADNIMIKEMQK